MAVIPVERKPLTLAERTYIPQIINGLKTTMKHLVAPAVTLEYPEQRPEIPPGYRGVPTLVCDPHGREKCVSCQLCEFVCPPKAIRITPGEIAPDAPTAHVERAPHLLRPVSGSLSRGGHLPAEPVFNVGLHAR
jgi:NADH-quinone oxidoreductase subunit I